MGSNCALLKADVFCYERDFMMSLSDDSQADIINDITKLIRFVRMSRHLTDLNARNKTDCQLLQQLTSIINSGNFFLSSALRIGF